MASDHRGRGLHAGKRTTQEMTSEGAKKSAPVYEYGPGEREVEKRLSDSLFGRPKK